MIQSTVRMPADVATSGLVLIDATGLYLNVSDGSPYTFEFYVLYTVGNSATFINVGIVTPTFSKYSATVVAQSADGASPFGVRTDGWLTASGDAVRGASGSNNMVPGRVYLSVIKGTIFPSATGTLQVQFCRSNSGTPVTVKANSFGILSVGY